MDPVTSIIRHGGVANLSELRKDGVPEAARIIALRSGEIYRVRNGWFSVPNADQDLVRAARVGGRLSCVSLLKTRGVWLMPDDRLHVAVASNAARLRSPGDKGVRLDVADPSVAVHWSHFDSAPPRNAAQDTITAAIGHIVLCAPTAHALVAIDSALNLKLLTMTELRGILSELPPSYLSIAELADGRAQSGLETLARSGLLGRRVRVRIHVEIQGVGQVDCLVGDRVIVELDSRSHHLGVNYEKDRTRDLHAIERGYIVLRVSYHRVMTDWDSIERVILALVRRGEHEWRGMHKRLGLTDSVVTLR